MSPVRLRTLFSIVVVLLVLPGSFFAADVLSGTLVRIGRESISIRLADGTVADVRLPGKLRGDSRSFTGQYGIGDEVQVTARAIGRIWEDDTARYQYQELTDIRMVRRDSAGSSARAATGIPPGGNVAADPQLENAREVNLDYAAKLPNFIADENATRFVSAPGTMKWQKLDTIETEVTFQGDRTTRRNIRRNGKAWEDPFEALPGFKWSGGFGGELRPVFDPVCPTTIERQGSSQVGTRRTLDYQFSSPANGCFVSFFVEARYYNPRRSGHIFIEDPGGRVLKLEEQASGFPEGFGFDERDEEVTWNHVRIGETTHLLPVSANFVVTYSSGNRTRIEIEYRNHRHFETSSGVVAP